MIVRQSFGIKFEISQSQGMDKKICLTIYICVGVNIHVGIQTNLKYYGDDSRTSSKMRNFSCVTMLNKSVCKMRSSHGRLALRYRNDVIKRRAIYQPSESALRRKKIRSDHFSPYCRYSGVVNLNYKHIHVTFSTHTGNAKKK